MTKRDIVLEYLRCFCSGNIRGLEPLLAPDINFKGPFHAFQSSVEYLDSLRRDPPEPCGYRVSSLTENAESVAAFYTYEKKDRVLQVAQLFTFRDLKISEILIVFDGRGF